MIDDYIYLKCVNSIEGLMNSRVYIWVAYINVN